RPEVSTLAARGTREARRHGGDCRGDPGPHRCGPAYRPMRGGCGRGQGRTDDRMSARQYPEVLAAEDRERKAREAASAVRSDLMAARTYGSSADRIAALEERLDAIQDEHEDAARDLHELRRR